MYSIDFDPIAAIFDPESGNLDGMWPDLGKGRPAFPKVAQPSFKNANWPRSPYILRSKGIILPDPLRIPTMLRTTLGAIVHKDPISLVPTEATLVAAMAPNAVLIPCIRRNWHWPKIRGYLARAENNMALLRTKLLEFDLCWRRT